MWGGSKLGLVNEPVAGPAAGRVAEDASKVARAQVMESLAGHCPDLDVKPSEKVAGENHPGFWVE